MTSFRYIIALFLLSLFFSKCTHLRIKTPVVLTKEMCSGTKEGINKYLRNNNLEKTKLLVHVTQVEKSVFVNHKIQVSKSNLHNAFPSILVTDDKYVIGYAGNASSHTANDAIPMIQISRDKGKSWSEQIPLEAQPDKGSGNGYRNCHVSEISGKLSAIYVGNSGRIYYKESLDGINWSKRRRIFVKGLNGFQVEGKLMKKGQRYMIPVASVRPGGIYPSDLEAGLLVSFDNMETWKFKVFEHEISENQFYGEPVVKLVNNRYVGFVRGRNELFRTESNKRGTSWSVLEKVTPQKGYIGAKPAFEFFDENRVFMLTRTDKGMGLLESINGGKSWFHKENLISNVFFTYADFQIDGTTLVIAFSLGRGSKGLDKSDVWFVKLNIPKTSYWKLNKNNKLEELNSVKIIR